MAQLQWSPMGATSQDVTDATPTHWHVLYKLLPILVVELQPIGKVDSEGNDSIAGREREARQTVQVLFFTNLSS